MSAADSDAILLSRFCTRRDEEAFATIVQRHSGLVYGACYRVLGEHTLAQDLAQETFFKLLRNPGQIDHSLAGWLHRVATRLAIDARRSEQARRRREAVVSKAETQSPKLWSELAPYVDECLAELDDELRYPLIQHFLEGVTQQDLATAQGVSTATMSRRIGRGLEALRTKLRERGIGLDVAPLALLLGTHMQEVAPATLKAALGRMTMVSGPPEIPPEVPPESAVRLHFTWLSVLGAAAIVVFIFLAFVFLVKAGLLDHGSGPM